MAKGDPNPPKVYTMHRYRVVDVPEDCTTYTEGQFIDMYVTDPPDRNAILNGGGACDGILVTLEDLP